MNSKERVEELLRSDRELSRASIAGEATRYGFVVHQLSEAIAADLDAPIRWRPIAEAPKDGTEVVGYLAGSLPCVRPMMWDEPDDGWFDVEGSRFEPTHFAELKGPDQ